MMILVPLADGRSINIGNHSIVGISRPEESYSFGPSNRKSQCYCRDLLIQHAIRKWSDDFIIMSNSDEVELAIKNAERMKEFLKKADKSIGAVALRTRKSFNITDEMAKISRHIDIACVMFRYKVLKYINFGESNGKLCPCQELYNQLEVIGSKIIFLPDEE